MKQRDMLLVPFPFSDQSGNKVRPILVLSKDEYNKSSDDLIVCAITSNLNNNKFAVNIEQKDLEEGILYERSAVKVENILKIKKFLIIKKIGVLNNKVFGRVLLMLKTIFE